MKKIVFFSLLFIFITLQLYAGKIQFSFYDAPVKDIAVIVSEITDTSISGSFGDKRMTLVADDLDISDVIPLFSSSLSSIGLALVKSDWGYVVRPHEQGFDPVSGFSVCRLTYVAAADVVASVQQAMGTSGTASAVGTHQILLTGPPDQVSKYASIVRSLDVPASIDVDRFEVRHLRVSEAISRLASGATGAHLIPDYWGKAIVVQGSPSARALVLATLRAIDQPSPGKITKVLPLHTQTPEQVIPILNGLFDGLVVQSSGASLFLSGPADLLHDAELLVAELDSSSVQVRVECVIASLTDEEFQELGLRLTSAAESSTRLNLNAAGYASLLTPGPGLLVDIVSGATDVGIAARDSKNRGQVISSPTLAALSGHTARIMVGRNIPFIDKKSRTDSGESEYSIRREDIGVSLAITPKVEGDFVYLKIAQEVSNIDPSTRDAVDLVTEKKEIESTVKLADGESIFLGGVKSYESGEMRERIPILSAMPLIGDIFTYKKQTENNQNIVVSIRPTIVRQKI